MRQQLADYRVFWREFRQSFQSTGAVLPSGPGLAKALAHYVANGGSSRRILEVGAGTGAVTRHIVAAMRPDDQLLLVESNAQFVNRLQHRLDGDPSFRSHAGQVSLAHTRVEELPEEEPFDLIISGLPLNNFSVAVVEQILGRLRRLLMPGGVLSFFEYVAIRRAKMLFSRTGERQRLRGIGRVLDEWLDGKEVRRDCVLANIPPAWVHHVRW